MLLSCHAERKVSFISISVAAIRKEKDLPPLRQFVIDVITAEDSANDLAAESDPLRLKELKMGSTYIRQELARRAGEGGRS